MNRAIRKLAVVCLAALSISLSAQRTLVLGNDEGSPVTDVTLLVFSETMQAIVPEDSTSTSNRIIFIKSLPPLSEDSVPLRITLPKGKYTLQRSPDLSIPFDHRVYIEDLWEEKNYNLNTSVGYNFKMSEMSSERFVLRIERPVLRNSSYTVR